MKKIKIYQVDSFATEVFKGNPAAVCPLDQWLPDDAMQNIAAENNLSETAFLVKEDADYHIRWFTPTSEVDLCGHATLAAAYVIFEHLEHPDLEINFKSLSGNLRVNKSLDGYTLDFPEWSFDEVRVPQEMRQIMGVMPIELYKGEDWVAIYESESDVRELKPNFAAMKDFEDARGIIASAKGDDVDFVSRAFFPKIGIEEDPVTGSAHCILTPIWAQKLGKDYLSARQISARGGDLSCLRKDGRIHISGQAKLFMEGDISL